MIHYCTSLTTAPDLLAETLAESCYANMFNGCISLATAPALPATTLAAYCYQNMFDGCISLTTAPELPATTLAESCYLRMFQNCSKLKVTTVQPSGGCYQIWHFTEGGWSNFNFMLKGTQSYGIDEDTQAPKTDTTYYIMTNDGKGTKEENYTYNTTAQVSLSDQSGKAIVGCTGTKLIVLPEDLSKDYYITVLPENGDEEDITASKTKSLNYGEKALVKVFCRGKSAFTVTLAIDKDDNIEVNKNRIQRYVNQVKNAATADTEYKFTARANSTPGATEKQAIEEKAGTEKTLTYYKVAFTKTETIGSETQKPENITDTGVNVFAFTIPYNMVGKKDLAVYRYCDGQAEALTPLLTQTNAADGSYYVSGTGADTKITIYASKFSTYAIGAAHAHSWSYKVDESNTAMLKATCANTATHIGDNPEILTISASDCTYDGTEKAAGLSGNSIGDYTTLTIKYQKKNGQTWEAATTTAPTNAGTYKASITVDTNKTAYVTYTIAKAEVDVPTAKTGLSYTGEEQTGVVLPDGAKFSFKDDSNKATDAGDYKATAQLTDKTNYAWKDKGTSDDQEISWSIAKATPVAGDFTFAEPTNKTYDGSKKTAGVTTVKSGMGAITVKYYSDEACTTAKDPIDAGTYYVGISVEEGKNYNATTLIQDSSWKFTIASKAAGEFTIEGIQSEKTYNAFPITQDITVKDGTKTLVSGTDYDVAYADNTNAGTARVTVTYKGNYSGSKTETFTIKKRQLSVSGTTVQASKVYDAKTEITVTDKGTLNDVQGSDVIEFTAAANTADKNIGTDKAVTVVYSISGGKAGNYIKPADNTSLKTSITAKALSITAPVISPKTYDGTTTAVAAKGTVDGVETGDSVEVSVASAAFDNANAGTDRNVTVKYTLSGTDKDNYTLADSVVKANITAKSITDAVITGIETSYVYTGSEIKPEITVKDGDKALIKDTDYTVEYSNNTSVGTATVTVKGKGNYTGEAKKTFTIDPKPITSATVTLKGDVLVATGSTLTQEVDSVVVDEITLTAGTDYDVSDNTRTEAGTQELTITGKGNYTGEKKVSFTVMKAQDPEQKITPITEEVTEPYGNGFIKAKIVVEDDTPKTSIAMSTNDLIAAAATADDLKYVNDGNLLNIWLKVKKNDNQVTTEVKQAIENVIGDKKVGCYLDASLFKQITDLNGNAISKEIKMENVNNGKSILIGVTVPDELIANNSDFGIARYHGTTAEVLESYYDAETKTLYFSTNKFSDYAIIMTPNAEASPNTGITSQSSALPAASILIGLAALIGLGWILRKKVNG